jgi:dTDP-4-dehydrorhamnose 3,5-epimerase
MTLTETGFEGLFLIEPKIFQDERGYFFEAWNRDLFTQNGLDVQFLQDNQSMSVKDVVRGLHFQIPPWEQGKLVRVISGSVLDVVVDLRKNQPTFGKHYKCVLDTLAKKMLWIPPGFAHGFRTLKDNTIFFYKCTQVYNHASDRSILWNDAQLNIDWGIENPTVSEKDQYAMKFSSFNSPF